MRRAPKLLDEMHIVGGDHDRHPTSLKRLNSCMISSASSGSRLPVGSSAMSSAGRATTARAMPTRCCSPVESSRGRLFSLPSKPDLVERRAHALVDLALRHAGNDQRQRHVVRDRPVMQQLVILKNHADLPAKLRMPRGLMPAVF
jgi:hypothetical protein